ncbi:hypothetical protein [Cellulomonas sp. URHD0024]|uniref:hypothetical protein n=1 Tax=Cellulomonas sp. URHD0024 TaxID=1302620 RepID=UPI00040F77DF|nr:hypothetical protein [Cellulomonas sp. URHD0024]
MIRLVFEPSPSPSDLSIDATHGGSPGFLGFVFTFLVALAALFLFLSLTKQMRRVDRNAKRLGLVDDDGLPIDDDRPHLDVGMIDAGAAGPDSEVDADLPVRFDEPGDDGPDRSR